jgi:acyl-CoA synthetase (NDP forming)
LRPDLLRGAIRALLESAGYDALISIVGSSALAMPELVVGAIQDCMHASDKPVLAYVSPYAPEIRALLNNRGVPALTTAQGCAAVLGAMWQHGQWKDAGDEPPIEPVDLSDLPTGALDEAKAKALFSRFGIGAPREAVVRDAQEAEAAAVSLGRRVALKLLASETTHKSDVGGVALNLDATNIGARLEAMCEEVARKAGFRPDRFLVQEMVTGGVELILGMHRDSLGTAILLGAGGTGAELLQDTTLRLLPPQGGLRPDDARAMLLELKTWPLLDGYRGAEKADVEALVAAVVGFSRMVAQLGERLLVAEINPVIVLPMGQGVRAVDGVAILQD